MSSPTPPPPPSGQVLSLVSALSSQTQNQELHLQAIRHKDDLLSASTESYGNLCFQLACVFIGSDQPQLLLSRMEPSQIEVWKQTDMTQTALRLLSQAAAASTSSETPISPTTSSSFAALSTPNIPNPWIPFGQMAGLVLKNALLRPPLLAGSNNMTFVSLDPNMAHHVKELLLYGLGAVQHKELQNVLTTIIATCSVSIDGVQPYMYIVQWPQLMPTVLQHLQSSTQQPRRMTPSFQSSLSTIRKMMEDGPSEIPSHFLDSLIPLLLQWLAPSSLSSNTDDYDDNPSDRMDDEDVQVAVLQSLVACLSSGIMPSALMIQFSDYLQGLSQLAALSAAAAAEITIGSSTAKHRRRQRGRLQVYRWVCRSINALLEYHTQYIAPHLESIGPFMLQATSAATTTTQAPTTTPPNTNMEELELKEVVATEACEFWLLFATLDEQIVTSDMMDTVLGFLPQLIPILLNNMVYSESQKMDLLAKNAMDLEESQQQLQQHEMKPIFHRTKRKQPHHSQSKHSPHSRQSYGDDNDDGDNLALDDNDNFEEDDDNDCDDDDDDDNEWSLRKYAGASLDSMANLYGAEPILPCLLPAVQHGLNPNTADPWIQEACILALGAIAEGCQEEMKDHLPELYPYLLHILATPETPHHLPQVKSICAWTIGRYATWAVEQVQTGAQGHLLAQMTELFLQRLNDRNQKVQVACGSALGVLMETAGDLMAPYLEHVYPALVSAMSRYQGRSLIIVFDTLGIMADYCGPVTGERDLPQLYVPPMLKILYSLWNHNPTDRTLLPLMESLASIALVCGTNYQPYALETFENAMAIIDQTQLVLATMTTTTTGNTTSNTIPTGSDYSDEDADPIVCSLDLIDGLCEGLGSTFVTLVSSSPRYGQHFATVLHAMCQHPVTGVRMSALALLGDLARNAPTLIEVALPQLLREAIANIDPAPSSYSSRETPSSSTLAAESSLCNNAVWAIGEICVQCGANPAPLEPFAPELMQKLIGLLMGNGGSSRVSAIPGLAENAAACMGRLANVHPPFVASDLSRCLLGWCDGLAKIMDPTERRDAFTGFCRALYANPQAIQHVVVVTQATSSTTTSPGTTTHVADAISSIVFAILSWHIPPPDTASSNDDFWSPSSLSSLARGGGGGEMDHDDNNGVTTAAAGYFQPFPPTEARLGEQLAQLMRDLRGSVGDEVWNRVRNQLPVNVRRVLREMYQLE